MGATRKINDIKLDEMSREGQSMIGLQAGSNKGASQAGMYFIYLYMYIFIYCVMLNSLSVVMANLVLDKLRVLDYTFCSLTLPFKEITSL